jgi:hypothetical protein
MRSPILLCSLMLIGTSAQAGPKHVRRIMTAVPRAFGRTAENMVTFKDPRLALNQWILVAAVMTDAKTSLDVEHRCPVLCRERDSLLYGAHPTGLRIFGLLSTAGLYYSTINQAAWELSYTESDPRGRAFERYFFLFPAFLHGWTAYRNTQISSDGSRTFEGANDVLPQLRAEPPNLR